MRWLVYDIETLPDAMPDWAPENPDDFPPLRCHRVLTIGMLLLQEGSAGEIRVVHAGLACEGSQSGATEVQILRRFSEIVTASRETSSYNSIALVDFNGRSFDMPVIQHRCFHHGIQLPWYFAPLPDERGEVTKWSKAYRDRYGGRHLDLCEAWSNFGASPRPSLDTLAKLCGLPGKHGFDGGQVAEAAAQGMLAQVDAYCLEDVYQTAIVFLRWLYLQGKLDVVRYRHAVGRVLACWNPGDSGGIDPSRLLLEGLS